jgi:mannose-6-phosphate isomerase-like protein (cupin superfamily)
MLEAGNKGVNMHIPFSSTGSSSEPENSIRDYEIDESIGLSYQELSGRGPKAGRYLNKECHEIFFILKGSATFVVGSETYKVHEKDVVVVEPNTPFNIDGDKLVYLTITRPDWFEEQYEIIPS